MEKESVEIQRPAQHQVQQPGIEAQLGAPPAFEKISYHGSGKLKDKVALITGGDSGIGRAAAIAFAKEGADIVIVYLNEHEDALETKHQIEAENRRCITIAGDIGSEQFCIEAVKLTLDAFQRIDVLVKNAGVQFPQDNIEKITADQLEKTFRTNIFSDFFMTKAVLPHLKEGSAIDY